MKRILKLVSVVSVLVFPGGVYAAAVADDTQGSIVRPDAVTMASGPTSSEVSPDRLAQWRRFWSGWGFEVVKRAQHDKIRVHLVPSTSTQLPDHLIAKGRSMDFDSVQQLSDFLRAVGAGVRIREGDHPPGGSVYEVPFTKEERSQLFLDDWLGAESDLAESVIAQASTFEAAPFDWIKRWQFFRRTIEGEPVYLYQAEGRFGIVSGDPRKLVALVHLEESGREDFVRDRLAAVALALLGRSGATIVSRELLERRAAVPEELGSSPARRASEVVLERYAGEGPPVCIGTDNYWTLSMAVLNLDGSVEQWEMEGRVGRFSIMTSRRMVVEPPGTVVVLSPGTERK